MASALGFWILSERLTSNVLAGGGLILIGVYLAERERGGDKDPDRSIWGAI
jgi:drug/metabolite transporter (DMT)-like permease